MQPTVALFGISGVGKTTFLKRLAQEVSFQHLTAGSLISAGRALGSTDRDSLRLANITENQRLLVAGMHLARDPRASLVVLDAHVVIHVADELYTIDTSVFTDLAITGVIHLSAGPARIYSNRANDHGRTRPLLSVEVLKQHQDISRSAAAKVSEVLDIPFLDITAEDYSPAKQLLSDCRQAQ